MYFTAKSLTLGFIWSLLPVGWNVCWENCLSECRWSFVWWKIENLTQEQTCWEPKLLLLLPLAREVFACRDKATRELLTKITCHYSDSTARYTNGITHKKAEKSRGETEPFNGHNRLLKLPKLGVRKTEADTHRKQDREVTDWQAMLRKFRALTFRVDNCAGLWVAKT